jgi:adenosine deaminase
MPAWVGTVRSSRNGRGGILRLSSGRLASMAEMDAWIEGQLASVFNGPKGRLRAFEAAFVQAKYDGVTRLEIGEDVWAITLFDHDAPKLTRELVAIHERVAPDIEWLPQLGLSRHCPISALTRWLAPFLELGAYLTIDLYGDEFAQPIERFRPLYRMAKDSGLRLKAHVGEWGSADDVWRAVEELELDEVQHGIAAAGSAAVMRMLANNQIRLNVCPTSNVMLGRVDRLETHPIRKLYDAGVKVTVNTDDVLVFGNGVSEELLSLYQARVFNADELDGIRRAGLSEYCCCGGCDAGPGQRLKGSHIASAAPQLPDQILRRRDFSALGHQRTSLQGQQ